MAPTYKERANILKRDLELVVIKMSYNICVIPFNSWDNLL